MLEHVIKDGHSRYPVFRDSLDNVVGLLYVKDLFDVVRQQKLAVMKLDELVRKPVLFVTETQGALSVLREMRGRRLHLAIVTDEFGGTGGIVTLEDIIEEIVGDIRDEYDTEEVAPIQKLAEGRYVADAAIPIADLELHLGKKLPEDGDFESLGGLIVHRAGRVPEVGATVTLDGYKLIVREADETRVVKVEIVRSEPELAPPAEAPRVVSDRSSSVPAPRASRPAVGVRARTAARAPSAEARASATTVVLGEVEAASVASIMATLPDPGSLPAGALVIVPAENRVCTLGRAAGAGPVARAKRPLRVRPRQDGHTRAPLQRARRTRLCRRGRRRRRHPRGPRVGLCTKRSEGARLGEA